MTLDVLLKHKFPAFTADVAFSAPTPGVVALFGPSGCGKTTVMSAISGLLQADEVNIVLDGKVLSDLAPANRRVGVVFQDGRLFPHMTVKSNLLYGMRRAPKENGKVHISFDETVELLGIGHLLDRKPRRLSGGERQRVAIGRGLLAQPDLLLMDEPLSALDASRKHEILPFLKRLHDDLDIPMVLISHSIAEVAQLADTLVLLEKGKVTASGPVGEILARADLPFASSINAGAVLPAKVKAHHNERWLTELDAEGVSIFVPISQEPVGSKVRIRVPANEVVLGTVAPPQNVSANNILSGTVRNLRETHDKTMAMAEVVVGNTLILSQLTPDSVVDLAIVPGKPVYAMFKSIGVQVY